jgi:outer membrane protease
MLRNFKVLLAVFAIIVIAGSAYAFAAANTVPDSSVGSGVGVVSGYTVSDIVYTFATGDPTKVSKIEFTLDKAATSVKIQLDATATTGDTLWNWAPCTIATGTSVTCTPTATLLTADIKALNVAAKNN